MFELCCGLVENYCCLLVYLMSRGKVVIWSRKLSICSLIIVMVSQNMRRLVEYFAELAVWHCNPQTFHFLYVQSDP